MTENNVGPVDIARSETVCDECAKPIRPGHLIVPVGDHVVHLGCFRLVWERT